MFGEVPNIWKEVLVTAIPKKDCNTQLANYRPISISPVPSKILEKIIRDELLEWFLKQHVIPREQHGFLPEASTTTLLADSIYDWISSLSNDESVDVVFFDLSKAFDKVNHSKLLSKLEHYGVRGQILAWLKAFLSERCMTVRVNNNYSNRYACSSGVPQGAVISPLLFLAYTFDLPNFLKTSPLIKVQMYADDIKIYSCYNERNRQEALLALSGSIEKMLAWSQAWDLPVNLSKSVIMHIGNGSSPDFRFNDVQLREVRSVRDLGVMVDCSLKFHEHLDQVVSKALTILFTIFRNVHTKDPNTLIRLYKTYVLPRLEYCSVAWSPYLKKHIRKIEKVQKIFTRILFRRAFPDPNYPETLPSYEQRLEKLKLRSLLYRRVVNDLVFCFRILRNETRLQASKYWTMRPTFGRSGTLVLHYDKMRKHQFNICYNSLFSRTARWFRLLPDDVVSSCDSKKFRKRLNRLNVLDILKISDV
ncbi:hypothetical protein Y032_0007g3312 [Ancylostoma ceylanicum]|uniref:Reverse transcriptase domain-containing protein n=1 Tax=Ancylostoma ceylanicum TaxID=53326 RepID=A0A016VNM2_9BILA|nr:hypothetical protein Y032_0007g3312 [Ancylostoma ceylanicum]